ncbi:MAG: polysaccharide biosynthesis/export family protein [Thermodesulfobacteriota bacterium]
MFSDPRKWSGLFLAGLLLSVFSMTSAHAADTPIPAERPADYIIGGGDILEIKTWKEPDFSIPDVIVRIDGKISFPLLNDVQAAGRTPMQLKRELEEKLKMYVESPVVNVIVKNPLSQKIYILGEVVRTGEYNLTKPLTVLQAFALAGGFTEWASKTEIVLLRQEGRTVKSIRIDFRNIVKGKDLEQNMMLKADDTIIVP